MKVPHFSLKLCNFECIPCDTPLPCKPIMVGTYGNITTLHQPCHAMKKFKIKGVNIIKNLGCRSYVWALYTISRHLDLPVTILSLIHSILLIHTTEYPIFLSIPSHISLPLCYDVLIIFRIYIQLRFPPSSSAMSIYWTLTYLKHFPGHRILYQ